MAIHVGLSTACIGCRVGSPPLCRQPLSCHCRPRVALAFMLAHRDASGITSWRARLMALCRSLRGFAARPSSRPLPMRTDPRVGPLPAAITIWALSKGGERTGKRQRHAKRATSRRRAGRSVLPVLRFPLLHFLPSRAWANPRGLFESRGRSEQIRQSATLSSSGYHEHGNLFPPGQTHADASGSWAGPIHPTSSRPLAA